MLKTVLKHLDIWHFKRSIKAVIMEEIRIFSD